MPLLLLLLAVVGIGLYTYSATAEAGIDPVAPPLPENLNPLSNFSWIENMNGDENVMAFLAVIRAMEAGHNDSFDYDDLYGGGTFEDFSDHPANLGWPGVRLSNGLKTTAAGAYQITKTTWNAYKAEAGLTTFFPADQDAFAIFLLKKRGAYDLVRAGRFEEAFSKLPSEWESFGKALSGNYPISVSAAKGIFLNNGGNLA